jgi:hypothetical protein
MHCLASGNMLVVRINGREERVAVPEKGAAILSLAGLAKAGQNTAEILFENIAALNGGSVGIDEAQGITRVVLVPAGAESAEKPAEKDIDKLELCRQTQGLAEQWGSSDSATGWQPYDAKAVPSRTLTWYRMNFSTPAGAQAGWHLHLEADANAFVYLNGHLLGRYWAQGPQRDVWLPECWLAFGNGEKNPPNTIVLQARPTTDGPAIKAVDVRQSGN